MERIYLDHCATTPVHPEVMAAMMKYFGNIYGNAGSAHAFGREAGEAVNRARKQVSALLGAEAGEILFTGGGTEADNLAILGLAAAAPEGKNHIVTSSIEHPAVLNACRFLETKNYEVTYLPVDSQGVLDPVDVAAAVTDRTCMISIIHGNNEVGVIEPLAAVCGIARAKGIPVHTDAVQTVGKMPFDVQDLPVDCLSLAGHKLYGPKGVGALYVRRGTALKPLSFGGQQEFGLRAGTENVPGIVGLGQACDIALRDMAVQMDQGGRLRNRLEKVLTDAIPDVRIHAASAIRLPHILSVSFFRLSGDVLVRELDRKGIAVSAGAACHAETLHVSHVLEAMRVPLDYAAGTIRFSLGRGTTEEEIDRTGKIMTRLVAGLRRKP